MELSEPMVLRHLQVEAFDPEERAYIFDQLLPAAQESAQSFVDRKVYPTTEAMTADMEAGAAGRYPMVATRAYLQAVLLILGHLYRNREAVADASLRQLPMGAYSLLWPLRSGLGI